MDPWANLKFADGGMHPAAPVAQSSFDLEAYFNLLKVSIVVVERQLNQAPPGGDSGANGWRLETLSSAKQAVEIGERYLRTLASHDRSRLEGSLQAKHLSGDRNLSLEEVGHLAVHRLITATHKRLEAVWMHTTRDADPLADRWNGAEISRQVLRHIDRLNQRGVRDADRILQDHTDILAAWAQRFLASDGSLASLPQVAVDGLLDHCLLVDAKLQDIRRVSTLRLERLLHPFKEMWELLGNVRWICGVFERLWVLGKSREGGIARGMASASAASLAQTVVDEIEYQAWDQPNPPGDVSQVNAFIRRAGDKYVHHFLTLLPTAVGEGAYHRAIAAAGRLLRRIPAFASEGSSSLVDVLSTTIGDAVSSAIGVSTQIGIQTLERQEAEKSTREKIQRSIAHSLSTAGTNLTPDELAERVAADLRAENIPATGEVVKRGVAKFLVSVAGAMVGSAARLGAKQAPSPLGRVVAANAGTAISYGTSLVERKIVNPMEDFNDQMMWVLAEQVIKANSRPQRQAIPTAGRVKPGRTGR